jgi:hypothetical protein
MASGVRRVAAEVRRLRQQKAWELGGLFSPWLELPESFGNPKRRRLFSPLADVLALPLPGALGGQGVP